jgi:hypothetical protein
LKDWQNFIIELLKQGKEYLNLLAPILVAYLAPSPLKRKPKVETLNGPDSINGK